MPHALRPARRPLLAALGAALGQALDGRAGVMRYGSATVPMDEARATAAVDVPLYARYGSPHRFLDALAGFEETVSDVGAEATATGIAEVMAPPEVPTLVTADTRNQYDVPFASPVTSNDGVFGSVRDRKSVV